MYRLIKHQSPLAVMSLHPTYLICGSMVIIFTKIIKRSYLLIVFHMMIRNSCTMSYFSMYVRPVGLCCMSHP